MSVGGCRIYWTHRTGEQPEGVDFTGGFAVEEFIDDISADSASPDNGKVRRHF